MAFGQMRHLRKKMIAKINLYNIKGISLLEAIVSTAIIGIGFVAILQMTNYSVSSINTSSERTKANFLSNMIAEDTVGNRSTGMTINNFSEKMITLLKSTNTGGTSSQELHDLSEFCSKGGAKDTNTGNIYGSYTPGEIKEASNMKYRKWGAILGSKDYMNCKGTKETRKFQIYKLGPTWSNSADTSIIVNDNITDEVMYIGKVQIKLNDGKKTKFLYFQSDYKLKGPKTSAAQDNDDAITANEDNGGAGS